MRCIILILSICLTTCLGIAQTSGPVASSGNVKDVVGTIAASDKKDVEVILNDLREIRGKIVAVYDDVFIIEPKKLKTSIKIKVVSIGNVPHNRTYTRIKYGDVLQIEGKNAAMSFVPDPAASPYSTWDGVIGSLVRGDFVQVHRSPGDTIHGVFYRSTPDSLSFMKGNDEVVIPAAEITKVYRVKGDTRGLARKILTGGTLGAKIAEDGFPITDSRARAHPIAVAVGAGVGTTLFLLSIGKTQRVLVYSR